MLPIIDEPLNRYGKFEEIYISLVFVKPYNLQSIFIWHRITKEIL